MILAAGQGTRMRSDKPKVLHELAGKTLLEHVYTAASRLKHREMLVVYGYGGDAVRERHARLPVSWVEQKDRFGTGHAVLQAMPHIPEDDLVLIINADTPLITAATLKKLVASAMDSGFALLTSVVEDPSGYGRIKRDGEGKITHIVEDRDTSADEKSITEINTGILAVTAGLLRQWLEALDNRNSQEEYYLTDIVALAARQDVAIRSVSPESNIEIRGINDRVQLAEMERYYQLVQAHQLMRRGVTIMDPGRFDLRGELEVGGDIVIDINVLFEGRIKIGKKVSIGPNCCIRDTIIGDEVTILPNCVIDNAIIGNGCRIGPFSRIRPDTVLDENVRVGNFVEIKKSGIGPGTKINHLSYVGDSDVGREVNIGAGTVTCNYDGANKHKTIIEDNVFIGSDTQLIAPVRVGAGATIAAGSVVTRDVEEGVLAISRTDQKSVRGWKRPKKKP